MLRWVIALISAYFVMAFGASAHSTAFLAMPQSHVAHSLLNPAEAAKHVHELRELHESNKSASVSETPSGSMYLQQVLDDLVIDLPDLLNPPASLCTDVALRVRLLDEQLLPPHSPALKRRPKPPRALTSLA